MRYYCNECKKTISGEEFHYSMNKYKKALCSDHQRSNSIRGTTKNLQDLMRNRHNDELIKEIPRLKTIKDWINADFETWDKIIKKEEDDRDSITGSEKDTKNRYSKLIKNTEK